MRKLIAAAILLVPVIACAAEWADKDAVEHYAYCRQAGGTKELCVCAITALTEIQPDPEKVTGDDVGAAVRSCVVPKPVTKGDLSI